MTRVARAALGLGLGLAPLGVGVAQTPREARAVRVEVSPGAVVWFAGGETRVGADQVALDHAITLCRRDLRALADLLGEPRESSGLRLRARLLLTVCLDQPVPDVCAPSLFAREVGARPVWLSPFGLDRTEVTVDAYARCVRAGVCADPLDAPGTPHTGAAELPVTGVRWRDAVTYCAWIGARLPTDAEWEHAARGREGRPFPWGFQWDPGRANHGAIGPGCRSDADGHALAAPVGSFPDGATPEGVLDLAGNVQEWVFDRAERDARQPFADLAVNPRGPELGGERVTRGGAYNTPPWALRTTWRGAFGNGERRRDTGFRCAWDPHRRGP